jgi:cobalt/nickel transport protein
MTKPTLLRISKPFGLAVGLLLLALGPVAAHFQVLLPTNDMVGEGDGREITLRAIFTHPMENGPVMQMGRPKQFGVLAGGVRTDLLDTLEEKAVDGKATYETTYRIRRPGDHVFFIEPAPYWEPAEAKMIIHYTKVVVDSHGMGDAWDAMVGFPVEIEPLVRPYGLWTGNVFRGIVRRNGDPVPFAEVEVEYLNEAKEVEAPGDAYVTQVIKADAAGVFCYAMPRAGWWAFAALVDGDEKIPNPDGVLSDVELGGLMWVRVADMD